MTTDLPYLLLAQLAADYRRRGMTETADLAGHEHAALAERFGVLEVSPTPPRAPWLREYTERLQAYRDRALRGDQHGRVDNATALACAITTSLLARCLREGVQLVPQDGESLMVTVRKAVEGCFQRIENSASAEAGKARFLQQHDVRLRFNQAVKAQERAAAEAAVVAAKARLESLGAVGEAS